MKRGRHRRRPDQQGRPLRAASQGPGEGKHELGRRWDEAAVKVEQAQECLELLYRHRAREIGDGLHPGWERANAGGAEAVTEEIDGLAGEKALVGVNNQAVLLQGRENRL